MAKIRLTKTELKNQKDYLKRFNRYLPTLQLKKQQLQAEIYLIEQKQVEKLKEKDKLKKSLAPWIAVYAESFPLEDYIELDKVHTSVINIAGVDIPVFQEVTFKVIDWDLYYSPLWVDQGIAELKRRIVCEVEVAILQKQINFLSQELRITSQRVNLFEKVKIPECKANIKKINVQLGDEQAAAVVRGKIAKTNLSKKGEILS